jgi:hypothetical protein
MAELDITIKRKNGQSYDVLYPTTIISQVTGLQTELDAKIPLTQKGAANGVATLDASGLIPASQLSAYIRGGVRIQGTMGGASYDTVGELVTALESIVSASSGAVTREELIGYAFIASQDFTLNQGTLPTNTAFTINPGDEEDATVPIDIEVGDILMVSNYSFSSPTHTYTFAVINNTYGMASTSAPGIVSLGQFTSVQDLSGATEVLTGNDLDGLLVGGDVTGLTDGIALAAHTHANTYLGLTANATSASKWATARTFTLNGDVSGSASIDGSANVTLTVAVADDSHSHAFANLTSKPTTLSGYGITDAVAANTAITAGTATKITYDAKGLVTAGTTLAATDIPSLDAGKITTGTFAIARIPTGTTSSTVALGDHTHTFASLTSKPTTLAGYGITDAASTSDLTNRPEIFYNTAGNSDGDLVLDLDTDGSI